MFFQNSNRLLIFKCYLNILLLFNFFTLMIVLLIQFLIIFILSIRNFFIDISTAVAIRCVPKISSRRQKLRLQNRYGSQLYFFFYVNIVFINSILLVRLLILSLSDLINLSQQRMFSKINLSHFQSLTLIFTL